jgi:flagellar hook-length control protein FliK
VNLPPSGDNLLTQPEPSVSGADKSVVFSRLASDQTSSAGGFEGPAARGSAQSVSEQIRESLHASLDRGERQVVIRLHPPELGSVLVRFQEQNGQIHGVLEVSRSDTRHEVEQALPQVLRSLQDAGIQIRKFDVTVSGQSEKDPGRQQLHQDAWPQQQPSDRDQQSNFGFRNSDSEFPTPVSVPAGRIDMLA